MTAKSKSVAAKEAGDKAGEYMKKHSG